MTAVSVTRDDLAPFAAIEDSKADAMIADALAMAELVAPCITEDDFDYAGAAKAVIRGAILRWNDSGTGGIESLTAMAFSQTMDNRQPRRSMFWPSEIEQLQDMCARYNGVQSGAFTIDAMPLDNGPRHADICNVNFGRRDCSCGALLTRWLPLYETSETE